MKNQAVFTILVVAGAAAAVAQEFELVRHTVDSGGVIRSTGGNFELSGTIGQADAASSSGNGFRLDGGFWFELAPGDCDEDGAVGLGDHFVLIQCFAGPQGGVPGGCGCSDADRDGRVDMRDFAIHSNNPRRVR